MSDLLNKNLGNITSEVDLFGTKIEKLSMRDRIGFLPISIWEPDWNKVNQLKEIIGDSGESRELVGQKMTLMGSKYETSIFNPHLAQMILSAYCPEKARIYDPFAGGGTRGFVATAMGHDYYGVELRQEEVDRIIKQQQKLGYVFSISCDDSQTHNPSRKFNFCYSCPPYYNLEVYSKLTNDLSAKKTFSEFMDGMCLVLKNCFDCLENDSLCVMVVGNFRNKDGNLVHFNGSLVNAARKVGFKLHDELIFWGASKCASQRCGQFEANRKSVRVHEYILIFRK